MADEERKMVGESGPTIITLDTAAAVMALEDFQRALRELPSDG